MSNSESGLISSVVPAEAGTHNHRLWNMGPRVCGDDTRPALTGRPPHGGATASALAQARSRDHVPCGRGMPSRIRACKMLSPRSPGR